MKHSDLLKLIENYIILNNISTSDFCRTCDIDENILYKIIHKQHYVSIYDFEKIAIVLNVSLSEILTY